VEVALSDSRGSIDLAGSGWGKENRSNSSLVVSFTPGGGRSHFLPERKKIW
jgi:hypothetical protein